jgi:hypothetical protein
LDSAVLTNEEMMITGIASLAVLIMLLLSRIVDKRRPRRDPREPNFVRGRR